MGDIKCLLMFQTIFFYGLFFISGLALYFFPPKKNRWYGFRTNKALNSDENWYMAQKSSSKCILMFAPILVLISLLIKYSTDFNSSSLALYTIIDVLLLILATVMIFFITEEKLKKM